MFKTSIPTSLYVAEAVQRGREEILDHMLRTVQDVEKITLQNEKKELRLHALEQRQGFVIRRLKYTLLMNGEISRKSCLRLRASQQRF